MSCAVDNNAFEVIITPSRKRKRDSGQRELPSISCSPSSVSKPSAFTNAAFSSTPKKEIKKLIQKFNRFPPNKRALMDKENGNQFSTDPCLEVKSIFDLVNQKTNTDSENPFEVIRKPPKKKKKADFKEACFVNPGLNLELPERQFNPFEVKRDSPTKLVKADEPKCFVNPALNIRSQETTAAMNPFEIPRINKISESSVNGIENQGLDIASGPLRIGIPFKPTVGCRIDFSNLTPSKMLAEKLVFSPANLKTPRVLADISEEDTTTDIGRELDRYQLELENSINEAKQRKTKTDGRTSCEKLEDIQENLHEKQEEKESQEPKTPEANSLITASEKIQSVLRLEDVETPPIQKVSNSTSSCTSNDQVHMNDKTFIKEPLHNESFTYVGDASVRGKSGPQSTNESFTDDEGIDYDEDDDEDCTDFKAPAPFVRAYRKPDPISLPLKNHRTRESLKSEGEAIPIVGTESKSKVTNIIRDSIRKLIHPNKPLSEENIEKKLLASSEHQSTGHHIMETIRHSLRRRPQKQANEVEVPSVREISIIDTTERKMKFKTNLIHTDFIKIEELTTEKKTSLRSSIRKSTRVVKHQIMKSVFHKNNEEYTFA